MSAYHQDIIIGLVCFVAGYLYARLEQRGPK